jgi:hypothetical protein
MPVVFYYACCVSHAANLRNNLEKQGKASHNFAIIHHAIGAAAAKVIAIWK